ncbi:YolD-like family protein [Peribacillus sp. SCS-155]|uniref:YolD-like family protein n=1 Tax=Peribacillus sedimenti TaxID=3115297 RepID=UPI003905D4D7
MSIRDRGKIKWNGAFFMPEHIKMLNELKSDYYKTMKPVLDEYQIQEFENKMLEAMEFAMKANITTWEDGYEWEYLGLIHRLDEWNRIIYLELEKEDGYIMKILFDDIINVDLR